MRSIATLLDQIHWSAQACADAAEVSKASVKGWKSERVTCPAPIREWLETLADFHLAHPAPRKPTNETGERR